MVTTPGYEQYEFHRLLGNPGVIICEQSEFCSRTSLTQTPFAHAYGNTQFQGKRQIGAMTSELWTRLSRAQRVRSLSFILCFLISKQTVQTHSTTQTYSNIYNHIEQPFNISQTHSTSFHTIRTYQIHPWGR